MERAAVRQGYKVHFRGFTDRDRLAAGLAADTASLLAAALAKGDEASLVVSGGSTPVPFFAALAQEDIGWERVHVTLADERWVAPADSASNEGLVRAHLLRGRAAAARFVGLKTGHALARDGEEECDARIRALPRPFAVVVLGMGEDGHTASFFPGAAELAAATDPHAGRLCQALRPATAPNERMTLTLPALLAGGRIMLHITGKTKLRILEQALAEEPLAVGVLNAMPVRHVLARAREAVHVYWAP
jgi:6-phosphogluconolactonase